MGHWDYSFIDPVELPKRIGGMSSVADLRHRFDADALDYGTRLAQSRDPNHPRAEISHVCRDCEDAAAQAAQAEADLETAGNEWAALDDARKRARRLHECWLRAMGEHRQ